MGHFTETAQVADQSGWVAFGAVIVVLVLVVGAVLTVLTCRAITQSGEHARAILANRAAIRRNESRAQWRD